jgi:hypothetical protein
LVRLQWFTVGATPGLVTLLEVFCLAVMKVPAVEGLIEGVVVA